jgi:MFS transporter, DHA1 family, purine base/nucleoside efflux pump
MILKEKQTKIIVTISAFFAFLIFGFADNLKGPLLPVLLEEFSLSYAQGSNLLLMLYLGFMLSILGSGIIAGKYGNRTVLLLSGIIITAGIAGMSSVQDKLFLYPLFFSIGIALGGIEIGANGAITDIYHENSGKFLNLLAVFHGAGSMAAPLIAGILLESDRPWQYIYKISVLPILIFPVIFLFIKLFSGKAALGREKQKNNSNNFLNVNVFLLSLLIFLYVASEISFATWLVDYLYKVRLFSLKSASIMLTIFWALVMFGRFIASFVVDRIGYIKSLIISASLALIIFSAGIIPGKVFSYLLPLTGLFFALIFPTSTALAAKIFPESKHKIFSILFFFAGLGGLLGPWLVGYSANWVGIALGFPILAIYILGTIIILIVLNSRLHP